MTAMLVDENPLAHAVLPTFSALYDASAGLNDASIDEQDVVFFGPPNPADTVVGNIRVLEQLPVADSSTSRIARTTEYRDMYGHLVAEVFVSGIVDGSSPSSASDKNSSALAAYAATKFGAESIRRFRTRIFVPEADSTSLTYTCTPIAEYQKDTERVSDVIVTATDSDGTVAARAWATVTETAA